MCGYRLVGMGGGIGAFPSDFFAEAFESPNVDPDGVTWGVVWWIAQ